MSEALEQTALFQVAAHKEAAIPELALLFHIPNGEYRPKATAGRLKAMGVRSGVPDILLPCARQGYNALWIELKTGRNRPTPEQEGWHQALRREGHLVVVCYGWVSAFKAICAYLGVVEKEVR